MGIAARMLDAKYRRIFYVKMKVRWQKWHAFVVGLLGGLLVFSIIREVVLAFLEHPAKQVLDLVFRWIGTFRWLTDYQTLIALIGAWWAANAVYAQIKHADGLEKDKLEDRYEAGKAVLPFALSSVSEYAESCCHELRALLAQFENDILPHGGEVAPFPDLPKESISTLGNLIEVSRGTERVYLSSLLASMQIQNSRLVGLRVNHRRDGHIVLRMNLERYVVDAAEIYAQAAALYRFARRPGERIPVAIKRREIASALHNMGVFDDLYDTLVERYDLASEDLWVPPFAASG